jgi:uncharacterized membrane protein HdeD (DUF308 family)
VTRLAAPTQRSTTAYSAQWALTGRAVLALLFGLSEGAMLLFAFWLPRITAALMTTFFTGFALLDGLVALGAAAWGLVHGGRWRLLACKGLTGVAAGIAVMLRPPGQRPGPLAIFAWWAIITGLLQAVEALSLGRGHEGRPYLAAITVVSVAFGVLVLARPPQDLMTLAAHVATFGLLLGVLRLIVAFRLQTPDLV